MTNKEKHDYIDELINTHNKMAETVRTTTDWSPKTKYNEIKNINNMLQYLTKVKQGLDNGEYKKLIDFNLIQNSN